VFDTRPGSAVERHGLLHQTRSLGITMTARSRLHFSRVPAQEVNLNSGAAAPARSKMLEFIEMSSHSLVQKTRSPQDGPACIGNILIGGALARPGLIN
jgi:hypothetical protein